MPFRKFLLLGLCVLLPEGSVVAAEAASEAERPREPCGEYQRDDGTVETGFGFVPTQASGTYVQVFENRSEDPVTIREVCACFIKSRGEQEVDFDIVAYRATESGPSAIPFYVAKGQGSVAARRSADAGDFLTTPTELVLPPGRSYVGVRWDPSANRFLHVCADSSEAVESSQVYYRDGASKGWTETTASRDPIFRNNRAIFVRLSPQAAPQSISGTASSPPRPR